MGACVVWMSAHTPPPTVARVCVDGRITQILIFFSWDTSAGQFGPSFRGSFPPPKKIKIKIKIKK